MKSNKGKDNAESLFSIEKIPSDNQIRNMLCPVPADTIFMAFKCSRWKVENEGNNVLKNHGYNLEHNFGHVENHLCELLLSLNLVAFLFHTVLDLVNYTYQKDREPLANQTNLFKNICILLKYLLFKDWSHLFS